MTTANEEKGPSGFYDAALMVLSEDGKSLPGLSEARKRWGKPLSPLSKDIPIIDLKGSAFSRVFRASTSKDWDYCIRRARNESNPIFLAALRISREYATTREENNWESPMHWCADVERRFLFLDGGFYSCFGNSTVSHGAWVWGRKAIRLLCYELNIAQRRRWENEEAIPTHKELLAEAQRDIAET